jgi:hypothetical protein
VIVDSKVIRSIDVIANDNAVPGINYTLDTFYYSTTSPSPNISLTKLGNIMTYQDNQTSATSNDSFFYIAKDQFGAKDTNVVVIRKSALPYDLYPGDANKDNICNNIDVLSIGIAYNKSESIREGIFKTDVWKVVKAYDWSQSNQKSNYRFSDADGNGSVDSVSDIPVIDKNYNLTSSATTNISYSPPGGQTIQIATVDTFKVASPSTKFQIDIRLGGGTSAAIRSYGIALTIKYDTTFFKTNQIHFNPSKWFVDQHNTLNYARVNHSKGEFDLAIVRRNGGNGDGSGSLGIIDVVVEDVLGGLAGGLNTSFEVTKVAFIDSVYNLIPVNVATPKQVVMVKKSTSAIQDPHRNNLIISQENSTINIQTQELRKSEIQVYNILGSLVYKSADWNNQTMVIDTKTWNSGIFIVQYKNEFRKIIIQ